MTEVVVVVVVVVVTVVVVLAIIMKTMNIIKKTAFCEVCEKTLKVQIRSSLFADIFSTVYRGYSNVWSEYDFYFIE